MSEPSLPAQPARPWFDAAIVAALTALSVGVAAHFQLSEAFYAFTRRWEYLQVDELSIGLLVLVAGLTWLAWRRYRDARQQLHARCQVESSLSKALAENRRLVGEYLHAQETERKHLARELHDHLGQYLNVIKLDASTICAHCSGQAPAATAALGIIRSVDHVHGVVRDLVRRLRPVALDELGLAAAIEHCVDQWRARQPGTRVLLHIGEGLEGLSEPLALTLFRLVQEALTNVFRHAHAGQVQVLLERRRTEPAVAPQQRAVEEIRVGIDDDGCGLGTAPAADGSGIAGMRERVTLAGGTFALQSAPGRGVHIDVRLPLVSPA